MHILYATNLSMQAFSSKNGSEIGQLLNLAVLHRFRRKKEWHQSSCSSSEYLTGVSSGAYSYTRRKSSFNVYAKLHMWCLKTDARWSRIRACQIASGVSLSVMNIAPKASGGWLLRKHTREGGRSCDRICDNMHG